MEKQKNNIKNLNQVTNNINQYPIYLLDANVWINYLEMKDGTGNHYDKYAHFLDKIIEQNGGEGEVFPKIAICSLLFSEILNRYVVRMGMQKNFGNDIKDKKFKDDYRSTAHYKKRLKSFINTFKDYESSLKWIDDKFLVNDFFDRIEDFTKGEYDFNDHFYYLLAKENKIPIVTTDGDFSYTDVDIITLNSELLKKS